MTTAPVNGQTVKSAHLVKITAAASKWLTLFEHPDVPGRALSNGTIKVTGDEAAGFASACRSIIERVELAASNRDGYAEPADVGPVRCSLGALIAQCEAMWATAH